MSGTIELVDEKKFLRTLDSTQQDEVWTLIHIARKAARKSQRDAMVASLENLDVSEMTPGEVKAFALTVARHGRRQYEHWAHHHE